MISIIAVCLTHVTLRDTTKVVIKSFKHNGLKRFFETGSKAGIQPTHATKLEDLLSALDEAETPQDMGLPGWQLHALQGDLAGLWLVRVNGNWRLTFRFAEGNAHLVDYLDYH